MSLEIKEQIIYRSVGGQGCSSGVARFKLTEQEIHNAYMAYKEALAKEYIADCLNEAIFAGSASSEVGNINTCNDDVTDETLASVVKIALEEFLINTDKYEMDETPAMQSAIRTTLEKTHPEWSYVHANSEV